MNRVEFMRKLAALLTDLPDDERSEALQFYNGYFYDAGPEQEAWILRELGSPEAVSEIIHREVWGEEWEARQTQSRSESYRAPDDRAYRQQCQTESERSVSEEPNANPWRIVAILALCCLLLPVLLAVGGVLLGLLAGLFGLIVGGFGLAIGLLFGGIVGLVGSVVRLAHAPVDALFVVGISLIQMGLSLMICWLSWLLCSWVLPWAWKGIRKGWNRVFHRKAGGGTMI